MSWLSLSGSGDSSVKDEADNAFASVTQLAARLGNRASPRADVSDGSASGRRSTSMIKTADDANVFGQISTTTAVTAPNNNVSQQNENPSSTAGPSRWPIPPNLRHDNGYDNQSAVFSTDSTFGGGTHLTPATRRARDLDLKNNDNSFSVIGGLICDFFAGRTTEDGSAIQLNAADMEALDRLAPPRVRLGFVEAVRHRIANCPPESGDSIHTLTRQCRVLGLDRVGRSNPLLAPAATPIKLPTNTLETPNYMSEPASVTSSRNSDGLQSSTGSVSAMIARFGGKEHQVASVVSSGGTSSKSYLTPISPNSAQISERRTTIEPVVETVTGVSDQTSQASSKAMQVNAGNDASGKTQQSSNTEDLNVASGTKSNVEPSNDSGVDANNDEADAAPKSTISQSGHSSKSSRGPLLSPSNLSHADGAPPTAHSHSGRSSRTSLSKKAVEKLLARSVNGRSVGAASAGSLADGSIEKPIVVETFNGESVSTVNGSADESESRTGGHETVGNESASARDRVAGTTENASATGNSGAASSIQTSTMASSIRTSGTGYSVPSSGIVSSMNTERAPSASTKGAQSSVQSRAGAVSAYLARVASSVHTATKSSVHSNGVASSVHTAAKSSVQTPEVASSVHTAAKSSVHTPEVASSVHTNTNGKTSVRSNVGESSAHTSGRSIQSKAATSSINTNGLGVSSNTPGGVTSLQTGLTSSIRTNAARTSEVASLLSTIEAASKSINGIPTEGIANDTIKSSVGDKETSDNAEAAEGESFKDNHPNLVEHHTTNVTPDEEANKTAPPTKTDVPATDASIAGISSVSRSTKDVATGLIARPSVRMQSLLTESKDSTNYGDMSEDKDMQDGENYEVAKNQLEAELKEASNLMADSSTPEAARFWRDQVVELQNRLKRMKDNNKKSGHLLEPVPDGDESEDALQANQRLLSAYTPPNLQSLQPESERGVLGASSTPAASHLDPSLQGVPMVDVVAPADLPGGYHFEAEIEGRRFLAIVPAGGVQKGETFSCYMRDLEKVASDIPVGHWRDGIFGCFNIGCCHVVILNALLCPLLLLSQIMTRTGLDMLGRPVIKRAASPRTLKSLMFFWIFINLALLAAYNIKWSKGIQLSVADICALAFVNITYLSFVIYLTSATRGSLREKYFIRESRCFDYEDCCCAIFCLPCSLCQMARHTADYSENQGVCCNETGLPVTYDEGPQKDNQYMV